MSDLTANDIATAKALITEFDNLKTFEQVIDWDARAGSTLEKIEGLPAEFDEQISESEAKLETAKQARQSLPFFKRLFAGHATEEQIQRSIDELRTGKRQIEKLYDRLQECIDLTPNSAESRKEMIAEFKARKKELQTEKRAVAAEMASIRVDARQRTTDTARGKYGAHDRRNIRAQKEAALEPHEDSKAAIERQIVKIERTINWLERFK